MNFSHLLFRIHFDLLIHRAQYKFYIEIATAAVLFYVALTDFRTFKIRNEVVLLLLVLYALFATVDRSWAEIMLDVILAAILFAVLLWCYAYGLMGGGDVKFVPVVCLWIGAHCALMFSAFLLLFIALHLGAARMGWAQTKAMGTRYAIPYAPSVAGALIGTMALGCI